VNGVSWTRPRIAGAVLPAIGIAALIAVFAIPSARFGWSITGPRFAPLLASGALILLAAAFLLRTWWRPDPEFAHHVSAESDLVWTLIASLYIGNLMLLLLNLPLIRIWVKVLEVPRPLLYSGILVFATLGVYSLSGSVVEVLVMYVIGVVGFFMRRYCCCWRSPLSSFRMFRPCRGGGGSGRTQRLRTEKALLVLLGADHVHDGVDQREVREGLREVAEVAAAARVDLLRVQVQR
jgi:hypothetical protein